ncbi:putative NmrA-like family protein [Fusarium bulbicola]|nr:putative NmrA-like family protein [Fusarium bulbicola]
MSPTFLVAGATGNTGRAVVTTLSELLKDNKHFSGYKILALTRSSSGAAAQKLARLPGVEVIEQNWVEITSEWLRECHVVKAFIASHNEPNQFAKESTFHIAVLHAGVEYVVRISTTAANVGPNCLAYYPRTHWAIETLVSSPEFEKLKWTSLQPNVFTQFWLGPAAGLIKTFRETGKQEPMRLMASEDAAMGPIDSNEVGVFAARLLAMENIDAHNKAKYVLNGPEDITGRQIVDLVEEYIGTKVEHAIFKDMSFIDHMEAQTQHLKNVILSIKRAAETGWEEKCGVDTTSEEFLQIAAPKNTPADILKTLVGDSQVCFGWD